MLEPLGQPSAQSHGFHPPVHHLRITIALEARREAFSLLLGMDDAVGWTSGAGEVTFSFQLLHCNSRPAALSTAERDGRSHMKAHGPAASRGHGLQCLLCALHFNPQVQEWKQKMLGEGKPKWTKAICFPSIGFTLKGFLSGQNSAAMKKS